MATIRKDSAAERGRREVGSIRAENVRRVVEEVSAIIASKVLPLSVALAVPGNRPSRVLIAQRQDVEDALEYLSEKHGFHGLDPENITSRRRKINSVALLISEAHMAGHSVQDLPREALVTIRANFLARWDGNPHLAPTNWRTALDFLDRVVEKRSVNGAVSHVSDSIRRMKIPRDRIENWQSRNQALLPTRLDRMLFLCARAIDLSPHPRAAETQYRLLDVAIGLGCRPGALRLLRICDVDLDARVVTIPNTEHVRAGAEQSGAVIATGARLKRGGFSSPLAPAVAEALAEQIRMRVEEMGAIPTDPLFVTFKETDTPIGTHFSDIRPLTEGWLSQWLDRLAEPDLTGRKYSPWHAERGFQDVKPSPYWLRFTGLTYALVFNGGNLRWVQENLAHHKQYSQTEEYVEASRLISAHLTAEQRESWSRLFAHPAANELAARAEERALAAEAEAARERDERLGLQQQLRETQEQLKALQEGLPAAIQQAILAALREGGR